MESAGHTDHRAGDGRRHVVDDGMFLPGGLIEGSESLEVAHTAGFTTLALAQLFNAFNPRSETTSAFHRPFRNRWLWASVALAAVCRSLWSNCCSCNGLLARVARPGPLGDCDGHGVGGVVVRRIAETVLADHRSARQLAWVSLVKTQLRSHPVAGLARRSRRNPQRFNRQVCTAQVVQPRRRRDRRPAVQQRGRPSRGSTGRRLRRRRWSEPQSADLRSRSLMRGWDGRGSRCRRWVMALDERCIEWSIARRCSLTGSQHPAAHSASLSASNRSVRLPISHFHK